jgi:signal transduction histidine kinase/CheY-like chemotaxis protein
MSESMNDRVELEAELSRLRQRVVELEESLARCRAEQGRVVPEEPLVSVPGPFREVFARAQQEVSRYFLARLAEPRRARLTFSGERYLLVRAASLSTGFFDLVQSLYRDRGEQEARSVACSLLFDVAHALGKADAAAFQERMGIQDPVERLSAGPVSFTWSGWGRVVIHPDSALTPDEGFYLSFHHEHSFEAEAWLQRGDRPEFPVCVMNAGYSSGWCEQSFGFPLVAVELTCRGRGDERCRFIMAPPRRITEHLKRLQASGEIVARGAGSLEVPEFFRRKRLEDRLRQARDRLEERVSQRTEELQERNAQLRRANERLAAAYREREEFIATVSHELRTPLVTGIGYLELLLAGKFGRLEPEARSSMGVAFRNLQRLAGLVDDILRYQQLANPTGPAPALVPLDLAPIARECVADLVVRTGRDPDSVRVAVEEGLPPVLADGEMLGQVLANLLNNAHTHAGAEVPITVRATETEARDVRVEVEDEGPGIAPEVQERATEPFVRHGGAERGLGLGLAIVQQLLQAHGSELNLRSHPGQGTVVTFRLRAAPRSAVSGEYPRLGPVTVRRPRGEMKVAVGRQRHVIVVEDDEDTRDYLALVLREQGCRVTAVATAEEALTALESQPAEALLVDHCLPGMSGAELCRQLKERDAAAPRCVYLITADAGRRTRRLCHDAGCDGFLLKPVSLDCLGRFVSEVDG